MSTIVTTDVVCDKCGSSADSRPYRNTGTLECLIEEAVGAAFTRMNSAFWREHENDPRMKKLIADKRALASQDMLTTEELQRLQWINDALDAAIYNYMLGTINFGDRLNGPQVDSDEKGKRIAELEGAIECACDFLDALQKETGVGEGTASLLRMVLEHKGA